MTGGVNLSKVLADLKAGKTVTYDPNSNSLRDVFLKYLDGHNLSGPRTQDTKGLGSVAHDGRITPGEAEARNVSTYVNMYAGDDARLTRDEFVAAAATKYIVALETGGSDYEVQQALAGLKDAVYAHEE